MHINKSVETKGLVSQSREDFGLEQSKRMGYRYSSVAQGFW